MRLWSLHPNYLDSKGLVALWRESLLARNVLLNKTKGYKNHPQLNRFKKTDCPIDAINFYLHEIYVESKIRGYNFDKNKLIQTDRIIRIPVTKGQINFEYNHLLQKLKKRNLEYYNKLIQIKVCKTHPQFVLINGVAEENFKIDISKYK